jgi:hypothetical protein
MARTKPSSSHKNTLLKRSISADQVLTSELPAEAEKGLSKQCVALNPATGGERPLHITAKRGPLILKHERARAGRKRGRKRKPGRKPAKKRGGWPTTKYLSHDDYRLAVHRAHLVEKEGYRFTVFATVRPPRDLPDNEAKKHVTLQFSRLGRALEIRGQPYVGMVTFEKREGGLVHGHAPLFVLPENFDVVRRWADRFDETPRPRDESRASVPKHACFADESAVLYALKQHRWAGAREAARAFYQKGAAITGARVSFTKAALAVIAKAEGKDKAPLAASPIVEASPVSQVRPQTAAPPISAPVQLAMSFDVPPVPLHLVEQVEAKRIKLGLTEAALAHSFGMKQPHFNNVKHGRDKFGPWARRRALEFIKLAA